VYDLDVPAGVALDAGIRVDFGTADHQQIDATGGRLDLAASSLDVASLTLVELTRSAGDVARAVGLVQTGGFTHGSRWGVLEPADGQWRVAILTAGDAGATHSRIDVGRLSDRDVTRWAPVLDGRRFRVVVFIEATPGFPGIEARFVRGIVDGTVAPTSVIPAPTHEELDRLSSPPAPEGWYVDPADGSRHRWWSGTGWTMDTSQH
jgi:hypothetical protein